MPTPSPRFARTALLALSLLTLGAFPAAAQTPPAGKPALEKPKVRVAVGGKIGFFYLPISVAEGLGYFKDEGLEVEFSDFAGGSKALQALVGDSADITSGAYEHTIQMKAKDIALKAFVLQGSLNDISLGIVKGKIPNYKGPADLKGKKFGVTAPGSATHFFVMHQMIGAGLKGDDAQAIGIGQGPSALAAVQRGELDAVSNVDPIMTELETRGLVTIVADGRTPEGSQKVYGGTYPAGCLYAKEAFIKANPNTIQAMTNAMVRTLRWMSTATPEQIIKVLPAQFTGGDPAIFTAALTKLLPAYSKDGQVPADGAAVALRVQAEIDPAVRDAKINVADTFDNSFAQKAAAKYAK